MSDDVARLPWATSRRAEAARGEFAEREAVPDSIGLIAKRVQHGGRHRGPHERVVPDGRHRRHHRQLLPAHRHRRPHRRAPSYAFGSLEGCGILLALGLTTAGLVFGHGTGVAVVAATVATLLLPGLGLVALRGRAAGPNLLVSVLLFSMIWSGATALAAAWATLQVPQVQYTALVLPALAGAVVALTRGRTRIRRSGRTPRPWLLAAATTAGAVMLVIAAVAFLLSVRHAQSEPTGAYGLLPRLGPLFAVAVGLSVGAVVSGCLVRPLARTLVRSGLVAVGLCVTLPVPMLTEHLLAGWAYKHLGIVDLIATEQPLADDLDALQQWPGYFAMAAQVRTLSGVDPVGYANLAQALFVLLGGIGVYAASRRLSEDRLVPALATLIYLCTMWTGQFYYAPQSMSFAVVSLSLVHVVTLVQSMPHAGLRYGRLPRFRAWLARGVGPRRPLEPGAAGTLAAVVAGAHLLVTVSHQFSPFLFLFQLAPLAITGWLPRRWRWGYVALVLVSVLWLVAHRQVLGSANALTGFSLTNAQSMVQGESSPAQQLAATGARTVLVLVVGGGLIAAASYLRRPGRILLPTFFACMPALALLAGSYGGEAPYRVWLFAAPWFGILIALRVADLARRRSVGILAVGVTCCFTLHASVQASTFGMYPFLEVSDDEIAASRWLAEETPSGSGIVYLTRDFPGRISAGYVDRNPLHTVNDPAVTDYPQWGEGRALSISATELRAELTQEFGDQLFLVVSTSMEIESQYYGLLPEGGVERFAEKLAAAGHWDVVYRNGEVVVFSPR